MGLGRFNANQKGGTMAKKPDPNTIPRELINAARSHHALFELARKYGREDRAAELFADCTMKARAARGTANRDNIGFAKRREEYKKGRSP